MSLWRMFQRWTTAAVPRNGQCSPPAWLWHIKPSPCQSPPPLLTSTAFPGFVLFTCKLNLVRKFIIHPHFWFLGQCIFGHSLKSLFNINSFFCTCFKVWYISLAMAPSLSSFCRNLKGKKKKKKSFAMFSFS